MSVQFRIVSIGALGIHSLWEERAPQRPDHATTVLIQSGDERILVDPSLPPQLLEARMKERTRVRPSEITQVFLTSFHPMRRRGLPLFEDANWMLDRREREALTGSLQEKLEEASGVGDDELVETVRSELKLLSRCEAAPDHLAEGVDLFPLPGDTPGTCGLLLALPGQTVLVCGDAVATVEHLERGMVLQGAHDVKQAQTSFMEAVEIADLLVPGRDNLVLNPMRRF